MKRISTYVFLLLSLIFFITKSFSAPTQQHYLIDTDMGFDDWLGVLYLLKQTVAIDAITIDCQGETFCPQGGVNASKLTRLAKRSVPIFMGKSRTNSIDEFPLPIRRYATNMAVTGFTHLKRSNDLQSESAAQAILKILVHAAEQHETVCIISIGTATNIADAWKLAQKTHQTALFKKGLSMIYKGGGAFGEIQHHKLTNRHIAGNIAIPGLMKSNNTTAEWNIYANAPAMQTILTANLPITFVSNNAENDVNMTEQSYDALLQHSAQDAPRRFSAHAMLDMINMQGGWKKIAKNLDFWDTATTIAAVHPDIASQDFQKVPMQIILTQGNCYGAIEINTHSLHDANVIYHLHKKLFYRDLFDGV